MFLLFRFVNHVFFLLPKLHGLLKTFCLECVLSRADVIPDIFLHLKTTGFTQMMSHRWVRDLIHTFLIFLFINVFFKVLYLPCYRDIKVILYSWKKNVWSFQSDQIEQNVKLRKLNEEAWFCRNMNNNYHTCCRCLFQNYGEIVCIQTDKLMATPSVAETKESYVTL